MQEMSSHETQCDVDVQNAWDLFSSETPRSNVHDEAPSLLQHSTPCFSTIPSPCASAIGALTFTTPPFLNSA